MQYHRVYSDKLNSQKNWYAYNRSIAGFQKSNTQHTCGGNVLFKSLQADIQQVNLCDIYDGDGRQVSPHKFGAKKNKEAYAITSFGILALALRQRNINHDLFASTGFQRMISAVNAVALEQFGANSVLQCDGPSTPNVERTNLSTTEIVEAAEISPPEKKRRVAKTGVVMTNALKRVAAIHNENIFTVLGNVASLEENSEITNILQCSTNVLFSKLHPKKAVNVILSRESLSALISSIRVPDWTYLLLKIRLRISDAGWQTLLNLTHLGRTGVSFNVLIITENNT